MQSVTFSRPKLNIIDLIVNNIKLHSGFVANWFECVPLPHPRSECLFTAYRWLATRLISIDLRAPGATSDFSNRAQAGARGVGFIEQAEAAGHVAGKVEEDQRVLVGHFLIEMMKRGGLDLDGLDRGERTDGGGAGHRAKDAHLAENASRVKRGETDGVLDDFDVAFDEDEEGVALVAFADNPCVRREIVDGALVGEEGLRGAGRAAEDRDRSERLEKCGSGGDHMLIVNLA